LTGSTGLIKVLRLLSHASVESLNFASWNRIGEWLRQVELRRLPLVTAE
jgi:hypothetical protein